MSGHHIKVSRVTLSDREIASILTEWRRRIALSPVGEGPPLPLTDNCAPQAADYFIRLACEQAAGMF